jgi:DNA-binding LacI/PurR family transcriptional regulator
MGAVASVNPAPLTRLAERLERDIVYRGLVAGDRYLTAAEAGKELGVSAATANRAMRLLAARAVLSRHRNRGTFVGPAISESRTFSVRTVFVLMRAEDKDYAGSLANILHAIRDELGDVTVQFGFILPDEPIASLQEMLGPFVSAGRLAGVVAISCQREVYCFLATLGVPLVINGSLYPNGDPIPSIDADNRESGRLLARYLIQTGHSRFAILCRTEGQPGHHDFHDGVSEVLAEMNMPATTLLVREYPPSKQALRALIQHLIQMPDRPSAFILRGSEIVDTVARLLEQDFPVDQRPEIVCDGCLSSGALSIPFVHVETRMSDSETARLIGKMLGRLSQGLPLERERVVIPVELCKPNAT